VLGVPSPAALPLHVGPHDEIPPLTGWALLTEWEPAPLPDQEIAGGLLWASGDLVALVVLGVLFAQWARASEREAVREDRRLDRLEAARARRTTSP